MQTCSSIFINQPEALKIRTASISSHKGDIHAQSLEK